MANSDYRCPPCIGVLNDRDEVVCMCCERVLAPKPRLSHGATKGLLRAVAFMQLAKAHAMRDWLTFHPGPEQP